MMTMRLRWTVLAGVILAFSFSSCTCSEELPEPPKNPAGLKRTRRAWGKVATPRPERRADRAQLDEVPRRKLPTRARPTALPTRDLAALEESEPLAVPDDFPEGVPVPDDAEVMAVSPIALGGKNVVFATDSEMNEVFDLYRDSMRGDGWQVEQEFQRGDQAFLGFRKGAVIANMTVAVDPTTGKKKVAVMYYTEESLPFDEF